MAYLPFPQFLNRYGITMLFASSSIVIPGAILEKRGRGYHPIGTLQDIFDDPPQEWETELQPANLVYGTIQRSLSLGGKASLNEFGINIHGGLVKAKSVDFYISGVKCRIFTNQSKIKLIPRLQELKKNDKKRWKLVNNNYVADYTYYATEVTIEFTVEGNIDLRAEIEQQIEIGVGSGIEWKNKTKFVISENDSIPFGFSGWIV